jgi:hypothetical protein
MSILSDLNSLVLRDTSNPPLTDKGSALSFAEADANIVKIFNAIQDIVSGANVPAYDAGTTYDFYSTNAAEKFASYDSKIWSAVYVGSPSSFSGQTPAESSYWTQVTLAQMLGNPVALTKIAEAFDDTRNAAAIYASDWQSSTAKDIFTNPIDVTDLPAESGFYYSPIYADFALNAGGVAYDFGGGGIYFDFSSSLGNKMIPIQQAKINSATDVIVRIGIAANTLMTDNDKIQLTAAADATVGTGEYWWRVYYQKIAKPF